jgi:hypothetical protein
MLRGKVETMGISYHGFPASSETVEVAVKTMEQSFRIFLAASEAVEVAVRHDMALLLAASPATGHATPAVSE